MASDTHVACVATLIGAAVILMTAGTARTVDSHEGHGGPPGHWHDARTSGGLPGQEQAQNQRRQGSIEPQSSGRPDIRQSTEQQGSAVTQGGVPLQRQGSTGASDFGGMAGGGGSPPSGGSLAAGGGMGGR